MQARISKLVIHKNSNLLYNEIEIHILPFIYSFPPFSSTVVSQINNELLYCGTDKQGHCSYLYFIYALHSLFMSLKHGMLKICVIVFSALFKLGCSNLADI